MKPSSNKLALILFVLCIPFIAFSQTTITHTFNTNSVNYPNQNTSLSGSVTIPSGVTSVTVQCWGAGGGGGGAQSTSISGSGAAGDGGGGGGGGYSSGTITTAGTYTYSVGAGGWGGNLLSTFLWSGNGGGNTKVTNSSGTVIVNANGGGGGGSGLTTGGSAGSAGPGTTHNGGAGYKGNFGCTVPFFGTITNILCNTGAGGGGGGGAGTTGNGASATSATGGAAGSGTGGGAGASAPTSGNTDGNLGTGTGTTWGGGGSGAFSKSSSFTVTEGGNGGNGQIIFSYTMPAPTVASFSPTYYCGTPSTNLVITGSGFKDIAGNNLVSALTINGTAISSSNYTVNSGTQITIPYANLSGLTSGYIAVTTKYGTTTIGTGSTSGNSSPNKTLYFYPVPSLSTQGTTVCSGAAFSYTPTGTIPTGTSYSWSAPSGTGFTGGASGSGSLFTISGNLTNTTTSAVIATYSVTATTGSCSNTFTLSVTVNPTPSATVNNATICSGATATLTATGGTSYSWNTGAITASITTGIAGTYTVTATNTLGCTAFANGTVTVNSYQTPTISISASTSGSICYGTIVTFSASITNGGTSPAYQWLKNGVAVGTNVSSYSDNTLTNYDTIKCILTSSAQCASPTIVLSNNISINLSVTTPTIPILNIAAHDSVYVYTFDSVAAGIGGNQIEWSLDSTFNTSNIVSSPATIIVTVDSSSIVYISFRSRDSVTNCVSNRREGALRGSRSFPASVTLSNNNDPNNNGTVCTGTPFVNNGYWSTFYGCYNTNSLGAVITFDQLTFTLNNGNSFLPHTWIFNRLQPDLGTSPIFVNQINQIAGSLLPETINSGNVGGFDFSEGIFELDIYEGTYVSGVSTPLVSTQFATFGPYDITPVQVSAGSIGTICNMSQYPVYFNIPDLRGLDCASLDAACSNNLPMQSINIDLGISTGNPVFPNGIDIFETPALYAQAAYHTNFAGQSNNWNDVLNYSQPGIYQVVIDETNPCFSKTLSTFNVYAGPPVISITGSSGGYCSNNPSSVTLSVTPTDLLPPSPYTIVQVPWLGQYTYSWSNSSTTQTINVQPTSTTIYTVTATDPNGCTGTASFTVSVETDCCTPSTMNIFGQTLSSFVLNPANSTLFSFTGGNYIFSGLTITLSGNIIIDVPTQFDNCTVTLSPNATITVNTGVTFDVEKSTLKGCTEMWQGITVMDGGSIDVNISYIEDAITAITLGPSGGNENCKVSASYFYRDYIGIFINSGSQPFSGTGNYIRSSVFSSDPSVGTMLPPFANQRSEAGVFISGQSNIVIGDVWGISPNEFNGLNSGIVNFGSTLTINNNIFNNIKNYNVTGNSWDGVAVYVYGGGFGFFGLQPGIGSDAPTIVQTAQTSPTSATFNNNTTAIRSDEASITAYYNYIEGGTGSLTSNYSGIVTNNLRNRPVTIEYNNIYDVDHGISLINNFNYTSSEAWIYNNQINVNPPLGDLRLAPSPPLYLPMYKPTYGVFETNLSGLTVNSVYIISNTITGGLNNIYLNHASGTRISTNVLNLTDLNPVTYTSQNCVWATDCNNLEIDNNTINGNGSSYDDGILGGTSLLSSAQRRRGISLSQSGINNGICSNTINNIGYGFYYEGTCQGTSMALGNSINGAKFGVMINEVGPAAGSLGNQPVQGSNYYHTISFGSSSSYNNNDNDETYTNNPHITQPVFSEFYYPVSNVSPSPNGANPIADKVRPALANSGSSAITTCTETPIQRYKHTYFASDFALATAHRDISAYTDTGSLLYNGALWIAMRQLYLALDQDTSMLNSDSTYQTFYKETQSNDIGKLYQVEGYYAAIAMVTDTNQRDSLLNIANGINNEVGPSPTRAGTTYGNNAYTVNNIYIRTIAHGVPITDSGDITNISTLAHSCPFEAGDAVYMARTLYSLSNPLDGFDDQWLCNPSSRDEYKKLSNETASVKLFARIIPNPATNSACVLYFSNRTKINTVDLYDNLGQLVLSKSDPINSGRIDLDISDLRTGVYIVRLTTDGNVLLNTKLVVAK